MRLSARLLRRFLLLTVAAFTTALFVQACGDGGTSQTDCGPATCAGCCDSTGACQQGTSPDACGTAGGACGACGLGAVCQAGTCAVAGGGDAGADAGATDAGEDPDAGTDPDAGMDAGMDAGTDAGTDPDAGNPTDAGTDAGTDPDAGTGGDGVTCGAATCPVGDVCCVDFSSGSAVASCAETCPPTQGTLECDGPEDCGGGASQCCGTIDFGAGTFPSCPINDVAAACASTCTPNFPFSCSTTWTSAFCHTAADCAGFGQNNQCCTFEQSGASATICVNAFIAPAAAACHP